MSKNTTATARLTALETRFDAIESRLDRALAALEGKAAPKAAKTAKAAKKGKKARKAEVEGMPFAELRMTLRQHKAAGLVEPGVSVRQMLDAGRMDAFGRLTDAPKPAKKAQPAKVAAKVEAEAPAKERKPVGDNHASQGPRDALGRITPKSQWDVREALALTGKFDRHEIDAIVASQA